MWRVVGFEWDEGKARENRRKHKIDFADAVTVFEDDRAVTIAEDVDEERYITLGVDALGRILVVVYTMRGERIRKFRRWPPSASGQITNKVCEARIRFQQGQTRRGGIP